jgi:hypothetical protein
MQGTQRMVDLLQKESTTYTEKLSPQAQVRLAFGFTK